MVMVAGRAGGCNFGNAEARGDTTRIVDPASPLLALRLFGQDHALEPGRDYLLGSAIDCDLRLPPGAASHHARLCVGKNGIILVDLAGDGSTTLNGSLVTPTALAPGDVVRFGDGIAEAIVVRDEGLAAIVPLPADRAAAKGRRLVTVRAQAAALRDVDGQTFRDLIAKEMARAPWLLLSVVLHFLFLLLLWLRLPAHSLSGDARATVNIELAGELPAPLAGPPLPPDVLVEPSPSHEPARTEDAPAPETDAPVPEADGAAPRTPEMPRVNAQLGKKTAPAAGSTARGSAPDAAGVGSGGFQRTVGDLRKSGLEIVFVFDSTGSMTRTIQDTKATIAQMLAVLRALVPDARIGIVTYRDHGAREEYLVRQVPLGVDFWRAANFMQFVSAAGGGDRNEDVRAGLRAAFEQPWRSGARRVVVLAGDAPPHSSDQNRLLSDVRMFAQQGKSFVHTLVTSPDHAGSDTHDAFQKIADAGRGICQRLEDRDRVLQRVLTLAFGREYDQDVAAVIRQVEADQKRVDVMALDLARRGGPDLVAALREDPVPQPLWNALVRRPRRAVVEQLIEVLGAPDTSGATRQAIAAALQQILDLDQPPIDPVEPAPPTARALAQLRKMAKGVGE